jgi:hypothetical protein
MYLRQIQIKIEILIFYLRNTGTQQTPAALAFTDISVKFFICSLLIISKALLLNTPLP